MRHLSNSTQIPFVRPRRLHLLIAVLLLISGGSAFGTFVSPCRQASASPAARSPIPGVNADLRARRNDRPLPTRHSMIAASTSLATQSGCALNCTATAPANGLANTPVMFAAAATLAGCSGSPIYEWDFGDGSAPSSQPNPSHSYVSAGTFNWKLTVSGVSGEPMINTVAGGQGERSPSRQAAFVTPVAVARDPQGRGVYVAEMAGGLFIIRFINTGVSAATIAGQAIAPGAVGMVAGGGLDLDENIPAARADLGLVTGLAASADGALVYFIDSAGGAVRAVNVSANSATVGGAGLNAGNVVTLASGFGAGVNGLAVNPVAGDLYVADASNGVHKVFRITPTGGVSAVAGNGANTQASDPLPPSPALATGVPLLRPRAVEADGAGNIYIADTGHARVVKVDASGNITLVHQFAVGQNPFPSGLALLGNELYAANSNEQTIARVTGGGATVAGAANTSCNYSASNCGDGGPGASATFNLTSSDGTPALAGLEADGNGLYILDQGGMQRGRVRYLNLSAAPVALAGAAVASGNIETIAGHGLVAPHDGALATGGSLSAPGGAAADAGGNLWISDTLGGNLRFVNRGAAPITLFAGTAAQQAAAPGAVITINKDAGAGPTDGPVNQASFDTPQGIVATAQGVFIADSKRGQAAGGRRTGLIRFVNTTGATVSFYSGGANKIDVPPGNIATIAGGGLDPGSIGDGANPLAARLLAPADLAVAPNGDIYIADTGNRRVRRVARADGAVASLALVGGAGDSFTGLAFDSSGRLIVVNAGAGAVLREKTPGSGGGGGGFDTLISGAPLNSPRDAAVDAAGNIYVTNAGDHRIIRLAVAGSTATASFFAGFAGFAGATQGFGGDAGPAANAQLSLSPAGINIATTGSPVFIQRTVGIATDAGGLIFADAGNNRIRRLSANQLTCVRTGAITITLPNPAPTISSLSPSATRVGSAGFALTVNGANFINGSVVRWNGGDRATTFFSGARLVAAIPASDVATAGSANVTVFTPAPGGGLSNPLAFTVMPPCSFAIQPSSRSLAAAGGTGSVAVTAGSGCNWTASSNDAWIAITSGASGSGNGAVNYSVAANPSVSARSGAMTIAGQTFTVNQAGIPCPAVTNFNPTSGRAGETVTITGTNLTGVTAVRFGGNVAAQFTVASDALIATTVPNGALSGPIALTRAGCGDTTTGVFTVVSGSAISGAVRYCITTEPVAGAVLTATAASGAGAATATSDNDGRYALTNLSPGSYAVRPAKTDSFRGLSALDAARVAQHVANVNRIDNPCQTLAADANRDGALTGADVLLILQRVVGLPDGGQTGKWRFTPESLSYPTLTSDQSNQNYNAVLIGDVTGDWARAPVITSVELIPEAGGQAFLGLMISGEGFQPGLSLVVIFPDGAEAELGAARIQAVKANSFLAQVEADQRAILALRVINPNGRQSGAFALPK